MKLSNSTFAIRLAIYIILIITFNSCEKEMSSNKKSFYVSDSLIYNYSGDQLFSGNVIDTINNQIIFYEVRNGIKNGDFKISSLDSVPIMSGKIRNNKNIGEWKYYYKDGSLETKGFFKDDLTDSLWIWYYPNGNVKEKGNFHLGNRTGKWLSYDEKGSLTETKNFPDSLSVSQK